MKNNQLRKFAVQAGTIIICVSALSRFTVEIGPLPDINSAAIGLIISLFIGAIFLVGAFIVYRIDEQKLKKLDFYPQDFVERDERESAITASAARRSFIVLDYVFIVGSILAMFVASFVNVPLGNEFRAISVAFLCSYLMMHAVFLLTIKRARL